MFKKILILLFMIYGMHVTTRAEGVMEADDRIAEFPRETYICGPSVVIGHGESGLYIFLSPTFEGSKDIKKLWNKDLQNTQVIIEPLTAAMENFTRIRPGVDMIPETYEFLCLDIIAYDRKTYSKLYAVDYYIYK